MERERGRTKEENQSELVSKWGGQLVKIRGLKLVEENCLKHPRLIELFQLAV